MIRTERLLLRRARMSDLPDMHRVFSDPKAMRYWSRLPHTKFAETAAFLSEMVAASPITSDDFAVVHDRQVIGKAGCWRLGEIGFILHSDFWGQGLGREALAAVIPHAFETLRIDRMEADVDPRNGASLRLLAQMGFRETGRAKRTFRLGDEWCDSVYLELPRPG